MKFHIKSTQETLRKFSIEFSKLQAQNTKKEKMFLDNKLKKLENSTNYIENLEYIDCRNKLDKKYEQKINGTRIRSKCDWYENGEKSSKFFLNLEETRAARSTIRNITIDKRKTLHVKVILTLIKAYFQKILTCQRMKLCNFKI